MNKCKFFFNIAKFSTNRSPHLCPTAHDTVHNYYLMVSDNYSREKKTVLQTLEKYGCFEYQ